MLRKVQKFELTRQQSFLKYIRRKNSQQNKLAT